MGSCPVARFVNVEVCCIGVSRQYHVAGSIGDAIVWVRGNIIKELVGGFISVFRGHRLLGSNVSKADEEFGVDGSGIVQQVTQNDFHTLDDFVVNFGAVVRVGCVLGLGAIVDFVMFVR